MIEVIIKRIVIEDEAEELQVKLKNGVQYFDVGPRWHEAEEAEWYANQLRKALEINENSYS